MQNDKAKREVIQYSMLEHIKAKSMWAGSKIFQKEEIYILQKNKFVLSQVSYPPVLYKIIDEIITNAIDHHVTYPKEVTEIRININKDNMVSVYNNGPGISIIKKKNKDNVEIYLPQMIYCEFFSGSNLSHDPNRIVGGTNGLGAKLTTVFSKLMIIETQNKNKYYRQLIHDGLNKIEEPQISDCRIANDFTRISFIPDYAEFETGEGTSSNDKPERANSNDKITSKSDNTSSLFYKIIYLICENRAWQTAAYCNAKVYFNDKLIDTNFINYCAMFNDDIINFQMHSSKSKYIFDVCVGLSDGSFKQLSLINGVFLPNGGPHIKYLQNLISENLKVRLNKFLKKAKVAFKNSMINNNLHLFVKGSVPNIDFVGQTKESYTTSNDKFDGYEILPSDMNRIWELLEPVLMSSLFQKQLGDVKNRTNRGKLDIPKYKGANNCGDPKLRERCCLIITEGDSATGTVNIGLMGNIPNFNYDNYGTYGVEGVIVNALKESIIPKAKLGKLESEQLDNSDNSKRGDHLERGECKLKEFAEQLDNSKRKDHLDDSDNLESLRLEKLQLIPNNKLLDNVRLTNLMKILNLDFNKKYELNEKGNKEFKTLRYGSIAGLTDADLDGFNIFGLICTFFMSYWPELIKRGYVKKIKTPIVRAYPKSKKLYVEEFYSDKELKLWIAKQGENVRSRYTFNYYKGLGSHVDSMGEVKSMFENIERKMITYTFDSMAIKSMYISYGPDTEPRKNYLSRDIDIEEIIGSEIPMSHQFLRDTKLYQRDNLTRKLLNNIDGFVISRRKVFYTARDIARNKIKVAGLSSAVVTKANYHHGEDSLSKTIIRMAQGFPGARNLPLLIPLGHFGSRYTGYKDSAAPRYIFTKYNSHMADKLFRPEDDYILDYEIDEGKRYEPKFYVPILPYVLLETNEIPATGWTINIHARKLASVIENTKKMITGEITKCGKLPYWQKDFTGQRRKYKNRVYFVGVYEYDEEANTINITDLPPGLHSQIYLKGDEKKQTKEKKKISNTEKRISKKASAKASAKASSSKAGAGKTSAGKTSAKSTRSKGIIYKDFIEDYDDRTTKDKIDILLYLSDGAYEEIKKYGNEVFDCFEEYLDLKVPMYDRINLLDKNNNVIEYASYEDVFDNWFNYRKNLYIIRIERETILTDLKIKMLMNQQRFSEHHDTYKITKDNKLANVINKLIHEKYEMFNKKLLNNPRYTPTHELKNKIIKRGSNELLGKAQKNKRDDKEDGDKKKKNEKKDKRDELLGKARKNGDDDFENDDNDEDEDDNGKISYDYLLDMNYKDITEEAYNKREDEIKILKNKLENLINDATGSKTWLYEIDELEKAIKKGFESDWLYGENKFKFRKNK
jgi:DNA topoisomerase-2